MDHPAYFNCFIIGEGSLPIRCAELLLSRGHQICGIISADPGVQRWSSGRGIPYHPPSGDLVDLLRQHPFDYLFSIVNEWILPEEALGIPRRAAINYHDAPLPRYGGTHATSWALMHQERSHGITWHVMARRVDAGDILKQRAVPIREADTAFTLNARCYEAAISAFAELIDDLTEGRETRSPQDMAERSYFGLYHRPTAGCVLSWQSSAEEIDALVRALDFGPYQNPLGLPKLAIRGEFFLVPEFELLDAQSTAPAGTVTCLGSSALKVATRTRQVRIKKLLTIEGQPLSIPELVARLGLRRGDQLTPLPPETSACLTERNAFICRHERFWSERLANCRPTSLPYARRATKGSDALPRSDSEGPGSCAVYSSLDMRIPEATRRFLELHPSWSTGDFLLAAFVAYLFRISDGSQVDIGFSDTGLRREVAGLERFFAPHVPLQVAIEDEQSFVELFPIVREQVELIARHQTYARDMVVRYPALRARPELHQENPWPVLVDRVEALAAAGAVPVRELTLLIPREGDECRWVYHPEVCSAVDAGRMRSQFETFLLGIAAAPDAPIARLPLLCEEERHQLLVEWNDTAADYPRHACFHELFEAQAERTPEAVAVVSAGEALTFRDLNGQANRLAHYLQGLGIGPEALVGLCVERSPAMVIGLLAILKAGGAYVPLDPTYPRERLAFMLSDSRAPVLVTQRRLADELPPAGARVVCLDTDWDVIAPEADVNPRSGASSTNLAYVIYTSGSTGLPKGVMIPHQGLVNYLHWCTQAYRVAEGSRSLVHSPLGFDLTITSLLAPLLAGQRVVLLPEDAGVEALTTALRSGTDCSLVKITPAHLAVLNQTLPAAEAAGRARTLVIGGEALTEEAIAFWRAHAPETRLINEYGPTETVVGCCVFDATGPGAQSDGEHRRDAVPIGRPIANTRLYVLDRRMQPVPVGVPGELYIGGDGVARGYLNRPELTAERFVDSGFRPGERLYRTGDLARYLPDGNLEYLGRIDQQVKIRGFRIELGEIEAALAQHPAVSESVVIAREELSGDRRLVAYVVPNRGRDGEWADIHEAGGGLANSVRGFGAQPPSPDLLLELRELLKTKLPEYMVPATFVWMETLPLTANGKVDRQALPAPDRARPDLEREYLGPRTLLEERLTGIWEELLGVQPIGVRDSFFDLGGHSLLAVRLFAEVEKLSGKRLPLATLFEAPTVEHLADILSREEWIAPWSALVPIQPRGTKPRFFCVHGAGGNILIFRDLAQNLGPDQPIFGLQSPELSETDVSQARVEELAQRYLQEIRATQPEGPYYLGGYSYGGLVATEMAQQLHAQGEQTALLAILDTPGPGFPRGATLIQRLRYHASIFLSVDSGTKRRYCLARAAGIRQRLRTMRRLLRKLHFPTVTLGSEPAGPHANQDAAPAPAAQKTNYVPAVYPGRITIFRARDRSFYDPTLGWRGVAAGGVDVREVPGNHDTILQEPNVRILAGHLLSLIPDAASDPAQRQGDPGVGEQEQTRDPIDRREISPLPVEPLWSGVDAAAAPHAVKCDSLH